MRTSVSVTCYLYQMEPVSSHDGHSWNFLSHKFCGIFYTINMEAVQVVVVVCLHRFIRPVTVGIVCSHIYVYIFVQWNDCVILKLFLLVSFK